MTSMDDIAKGWLVVVARDHFWRVAQWYDFDDLIQDGHMIWWHVFNRYERETGRVRSRPHLMRLFKTSYLNHINQLANRKTKNACELLAGDLVDESNTSGNIWDLFDIAFDIGDVDRMIFEAPSMVRTLLTKLFYEPPTAAWRSAPRRRLDGTRTDLNTKLCRVVGIDPSENNLAAELRAYLRR